VQWDFVRQARAQDFAPSNDWTDNESKKNDEHNEIENGVSPDTSLSQLRLLHRIDWWPDLTADLSS
jgi:hypothetical protein